MLDCDVAMLKTLALLPIAALAACNQPAPVIMTPPASLLTCADAPAVPDTLPPPGIERDKVTLALWLAEREAGADCRANLAGVREWVEGVQ